MTKLITIEASINPDNHDGCAWISYWSDKPTPEEFRQAFTQHVSLGEANQEQEAFDHGFWYDWNNIVINDEDNLADPKIHRDGIWVLAMCQMV